MKKERRGRWTVFQSPPSGRRATVPIFVDAPTGLFQSPPSGRRATVKQAKSHGRSHISIPTLRAEGDIICGCCMVPMVISIPTLRAEGDLRQSSNTRNPVISIPTLRAEGAYDFSCLWPINLAFQSPPSVRRATKCISTLSKATVFQSLPSVRRATQELRPYTRRTSVSIPTLRAEGDLIMPEPPQITEFQSPPSVRRATARPFPSNRRNGISIPTLRAEGDDNAHQGRKSRMISIPTLRAEGDSKIIQAIHIRYVQIAQCYEHYVSIWSIILFLAHTIIA